MNAPIFTRTISMLILLLGFVMNHTLCYSQPGNVESTVSQPNFQGTIRGRIIDEDSRIPLIGVSVVSPDSDPFVGTTTDTQGNFRLEQMPIGRINLRFSYLGYETVNIPNIEVTSGKEVILNLEMMQSAVKLDEVVVNSDQKRGEAINDLSLISSRSISVDETNRYTAGMDDPARMVTSYAGVTSGDGASDIIVRGNSPKYMQWYLDGVEITSPYHMDDQNATFGALTALNKSLLSTSDFYTGAFSPEYGNVLSNIMNIRLRPGNNEKLEATFGLGLMGADLSLEGPFKKGYGGSFLINYRYSSVSLINDLGLIGDVDGIVNYQDATFKAVLPTKKAGIFSIFGLGGLSGFSFANVAPGGLSTLGRPANASVVKDFDKKSNLSNFAIMNTKTLSPNSYLKTSLSYIANGFNDDLWEKSILDLSAEEYTYGSSLNIFKSKARNSAWQASATYNSRINARNRIQIGTRYVYHLSDYDQSAIPASATELINVNDFNRSYHSVNNFISWRHTLNQQISFVAGIHNMNVSLNTNHTLEPRIALSWMVTPGSSIQAGYGKHSTTEKLHNYFTKVEQPDGSFTQPNKNLGFLMADHYVLGFNRHFSNYLVGKLEVYYQHLYDLPVENRADSYFATINEGIDYQYVPLVNKGLGQNYGVEFTLERFFDNNYYWVFNNSLYESKYKTLEGIWRNTMYNGNYIVNLLGGKEFKNLGRKNNKTLAINVKTFFAGGQRYIPLLRDSDGNLAVDPANNLYWDYEKAFDNPLVHVYNVNLSISFKINRFSTTHEIFLDLMNIINSNSKLSEFYDESKPNKIGYAKQMPFLPNIMYRVYF